MAGLGAEPIEVEGTSVVVAEHFVLNGTLHASEDASERVVACMCLQHPVGAEVFFALAAGLDLLVEIVPKRLPGTGEVNKICDVERRLYVIQVRFFPQRNPGDHRVDIHVPSVLRVEGAHPPDVQPLFEFAVGLQRAGPAQQLRDFRALV